MFSSSLQSNLSFFSSSSTTHSNNKTLITHRKPNVTIRCGPRNNRGPLVKGRILSTEAMQAVQALKRAKGDETKINQLISKTLTRLIKNDLLASLNELLRQGHCELALKVFCAVRSDIWSKIDCSLYADLVLALTKCGMLEDIDRLICDLEGEVLVGGGDRGLSRLIKALIAAERTESVVRVYGLMRDGGWGSVGSHVDEYVVKILSRGLRRLGESGVADEVDRKFGSFSNGKMEKLSV
ncbi:hypothetical protein BVC80_157g118 [Macleaya cordata]|uniref:Pentatricopeptide repeat n=1 Tax=Macleaya cordata TaxID=56857 RepID=A0A200RC82_MACCD|nr:hypothetical protein BVC80_157g118 [Macleaya cordata]